MRQLSTYILSMIVMGSLAACSDNGEAGGEIPSADPPIELRATYPDTSISTKAEVGEAEAFKTTLFCVTRLRRHHRCSRLYESCRSFLHPRIRRDHELGRRRILRGMGRADG